MKVARSLSRSAALVLAFAVGAFVGPRLASGNPPQGQTASPELQALENKVTNLEKRLAAFEDRYATHKHNYVPGRCSLWWNLPTLKDVLDRGGTAEPGMGLCLTRDQGPDKIATSGPGQ
jgi:hypothetical protein